jgi:predicted nucleic acid-binding protein
MKIYFDNCCYNRPYDGQTQERIHLESEAVLTIVKRAQEGIDEIIGSDIIDFEMNNINDEHKKEEVKLLYNVAKEKVQYTGDILSRSIEIKTNTSIRSLDSLHIACAESGMADVMLTTDDRLEKACAKLDLKVRVMNPLKFIVVVLDYE